MSRQTPTTTAQRTVTAFDTGVGRPAVAKDDTWITTGRAAREIGLRRTEFDLAVRLGRIRTEPGRVAAERRVARAEIERLRAGPDFPEALRRSVHAVGTAEGAALLGVAKARFTRLARLGLVVPVAFHLNRYRAVVWLYLADELRLFGDDEKNAALLTGRTPEGLRGLLDSGIDLRPRNWRSRHLGFLLREAEDPWAVRARSRRSSTRCMWRRWCGTPTSGPTYTGSAAVRPAAGAPTRQGHGSRRTS